jgi:hypothetical protein
VATCFRCQSETQLYSNGTPICLACAETAPTASVQDGQRNRTLDQPEPDPKINYNQLGGTLAP